MTSSSDLMVRTSILIYDIKDIILSTDNNQKKVLTKCAKLVDLTLTDKTQYTLVLSLLESNLVSLNYYSGFCLLNILRKEYISKNTWLDKIKKWIISPKDDLLSFIGLKILKTSCRYNSCYKDLIKDNRLLEKIIKYTNSQRPRIKEAACELMIEISESTDGAILFSELYSGLIGYRLLYSEFEFIRLSGIKLMETMSWFENFSATLAGTSIIEIISELFTKGDFDFNLYALYVLSNLSQEEFFKDKLVHKKNLFEQYILPFLSDTIPECIQKIVLKLLKNVVPELNLKPLGKHLIKFCQQPELDEELYQDAMEVLEQCNNIDTCHFEHLIADLDTSKRKLILLSTFGSQYIIKHKWKPIQHLDNYVKLKFLNTITYCQKIPFKNFNTELIEFLFKYSDIYPNVVFSTLANLCNYEEYANYFINNGIKEIIKLFLEPSQVYNYKSILSFFNFLDIFVNHDKICEILKTDIKLNIDIFQFIKKSKLKKDDFFQAISILFKLNLGDEKEAFLEII